MIYCVYKDYSILNTRPGSLTTSQTTAHSPAGKNEDSGGMWEGWNFKPALRRTHIESLGHCALSNVSAASCNNKRFITPSHGQLVGLILD